jgi:hypothetical protein
VNASVRAFRGDGKGARVAADFYATPPEAIRALLSPAGDGDRIRTCGSVWEPACGDGAMVREIRAAGIPCCASDLIDRGCPDSWQADYFSCFRSRCPAVITNPPYALANGSGGARWVHHTLAMPGWTYMALLLNAEWERSQAVRKLLREHPYSHAWHLGWRIDWTGAGSPANWHTWFVWDREAAHSMQVRFLDKVRGTP